MEEIEVAVSVLAAVTLPLIGVGPVLMRMLSQRVFAGLVLSCSAIVQMLTRAPWAAVFTLAVGAALLLAYRRSVNRSTRATAPVYVEEGDALSR
jgi:lysylphosphatidylglycerol synthetase-like protein (DUF2156 family)